jgi:hypothetical protein
MSKRTKVGAAVVAVLVVGVALFVLTRPKGRTTEDREQAACERYVSIEEQFVAGEVTYDEWFGELDAIWQEDLLDMSSTAESPMKDEMRALFDNLNPNTPDDDANHERNMTEYCESTYGV